MDKKLIITQIQNAIRSLHQQLEIMADLPDDLPGTTSRSPADGIHFHVSAWKDFRTVRRAFKGWAYCSSYTMNDNGRKVFTYRKDAVTLFLVFCPPCNEGDMCRRVQVGVEETPVYEIVCDKPDER